MLNAQCSADPLSAWRIADLDPSNFTVTVHDTLAHDILQSEEPVLCDIGCDEAQWHEGSGSWHVRTVNLGND